MINHRHILSDLNQQPLVTFHPEKLVTFRPESLVNFPRNMQLTEGNRKSSVNSCNIQEGSVYLEIIFWTWFGLIASLLYNVSEALRTTEFKINEVGVHIAKFFYSPLISLVIYFSINNLISDGSISLAEFSHGTIVFAFILGFFSGRAIELLTRVKDLILPLNAEKKEEPRPNPSASGSDEESELVIDEATSEHKSVIG